MSARRSWALTFSIAVLAMASSALGILNRFTYDDRYIVELNPLMRTLHAWWRVFQNSYWSKEWGGDGYRPLTILAFRLEAAVNGVNPAVFHGVNIALYAATSVLVFALARQLLPNWAAWIAAALFAVHPVHVEAVANVVGQAELIVAIAVVSATALYLRDRRAGRLEPRTMAMIAVLYAVACFSKEHGIVLPALLIAAELTVVTDAAPVRARIRALAVPYLILFAIAVGFVVVRSRVLADHGIGGFQPFTPFSTLHISSRDRVLTALGVVPQWLRLLFWPARLSSEYGPPEIDIAQGPSIVQLPGLALLLAIVGIGIALRRRQPVMAFGVAIVCITLLPSSNFLLPAGIVLAERTLFLPSVGAMLIAGTLLTFAADRLRARGMTDRTLALAGGGLVAAVLVAGMMRSTSRTRVWRDNEALFREAAADSPRSYHAHYMLGIWAFEHKRQREGERELRQALNLFPYDPFLSYDMAEQYRMAGLCDAAIPMYRWSMSLDKNFSQGRTALAGCLLNEGRFDEARSAAVTARRFDGDTSILRRVIAIADSSEAARPAAFAGQPIAAQGAPRKAPDSVQKAGGKRSRGPF
jgi:protein O-mannosyl-transferase